MVVRSRLCRLMRGKPPPFRGSLFFWFERLRLEERWGISPDGNFELERKGNAFPLIRRQSRGAGSERR